MNKAKKDEKIWWNGKECLILLQNNKGVKART